MYLLAPLVYWYNKNQICGYECSKQAILDPHPDHPMPIFVFFNGREKKSLWYI